MAQVIDGFATLAAAEQEAKAKAAESPGAVVMPLGTAGYMVVLKHEVTLVFGPDVKALVLAAPPAVVLAQFRILSGNGRNGNGNGRRKGVS